MTFKADGFLSASMERFTVSLRAVPEYRAWFEFAEGLYRLGLESLEGIETPRADSQRLTITALFVRAHKSFAAALILLERGLVGDARSVLRSAVEGAIAMRALAKEPKFLNDLVEAHHFNERKRARIVVNDPDYATVYSASEIAKMNATIAEVDAMDAAKLKASNQQLRDVTWRNVGHKYCKDLYESLYRILSGDGTHTTIHALNRMFDYDPSSAIESVKIGPDLVHMVETLKASCLMFLEAAGEFSTVYELGNIQTRLEAETARFKTLPQSEPPNARVHF